MHVPVRVLGDPGMVPGSLIDDPVEDDGHTTVVGAVDEAPQVAEGAVFGSYAVEAADTIGRVDGLVCADGIDRHEVNHIDAQRLYLVQAGDHPLKVMGGSKGAD